MKVFVSVNKHNFLMYIELKQRFSISWYSRLSVVNPGNGKTSNSSFYIYKKIINMIGKTT